ncbi:hypothetical protein [Variovorax sp. MHTC-1]|uniref:hypothetical protein n=1 Tax=Variovorax sp. MHTC-1 TaxID=2495593 RepID=UPI00163CF6D1|nr:hypothetical protein [Variovorax sp. MHTC-1]
MYGISRGARRWKASITRNKVRLFKSFAFGTHGGRGAALAHAQAWRDEIMRSHPPIFRREKAVQARSNSKTGIPGVTCRTDARGKPLGWTAKTQLERGVQVQKWFSVVRYGNHAKELAIAERQRQLEQLTGHFFAHPSDRVAAAMPAQKRPAPLPEPLLRRRKAQTAASTNTSGTPGVTCLRWPDGTPRAWKAKTQKKGSKILEKTFYVATYGNDEAKALAIAERQQQLQQMEGWASPRPTESDCGVA